VQSERKLSPSRNHLLVNDDKHKTGRVTHDILLKFLLQLVILAVRSFLSTIGVARILSGVHFFLTKLTTFFTCRFQKTVHFFPEKVGELF